MTFENESKIVINYLFASEIFKIYICITAKMGLLHISHLLTTSYLCLNLDFDFKNEVKMNYSFPNEF